MFALLALHAVVGLVIIAAGDRLGRRALGLAILAPAATLAWLAVQLPTVLDGGVRTERAAWVPGLGLSIDLRLDGFAAVMVLLVSGIGVAVLAYSASYLPPAGHPGTPGTSGTSGGGPPGVGRLVGLLTLFSGSMVGLVLADDLAVLYTCWELTSVTSYLLIGNDHGSARARAAALQALLVTGAGGLAMLVGFVLVGQAVGTYRLSEILEARPSGPAVTVGLLLIVGGAATKSAQYPFHAWLPGAMVAPAPVSAYLHSATMVKAGVYLVGRLAPAFGAGVAAWRPTVVVIGLVTMLGGGLRALRQHDLKLLLAFGTISQLGFLFVLFGVGTPAATQAGVVLLVAHALFKAALFMVVGIVEHETGTRDLRALPGLGRGWAAVVVTGVASAASMAGVPLALGFVAKEAAFEAFAHGEPTGAALVLAVLVAGSVLTTAYSIRFVWGAFTAGATNWAGAPGPVATDHLPAARFVAPAAALALFTVGLGVVPALADGLVGAATRALDPRAPATHLALWHGLNLPLWLSGVALGGGVLLFVARRPVARVLATGHHLPSGADAYLGSLRGLNTIADRVTRTVQNGSLPFYAAVVLLTAAVGSGVALLVGGSWPGWPPVLDTPAHLPVVAVLVGGALGAALARRRLVAVVFLSSVGYAMAGLFVVEGAPDLALTQVTMETLSTVVFVLVLRRLPDRFNRPSRVGRPVRLVVAGVVGLVVFSFALVAAGNRTAPSVSAEMVDRALPDGGGRNVVNVILVDFRGFDTLGEVTVLAVAAVGAVALARAGRSRSVPPGGVAATPPPNPVTHPVANRGIRRLMVVDVSVRVIFHTVVLGSIWLLFAGHNQPGGGFVGGLLAGAAIALRFVAGGIDDVRRITRLRPWTILGSGILVATITALVPIALGHPVLSSATWTLEVPLLGTIKTTSALPFDIGVYLVVVGLVLMVFEAFGDEPVGTTGAVPR